MQGDLDIPGAELLPLGQTLIDRFQRMICKLYGLGLIIAGPGAEDFVD